MIRRDEFNGVGCYVADLPNGITKVIYDDGRIEYRKEPIPERLAQVEESERADGEVEGHPFRGNQWVSGQEGESGSGSPPAEVSARVKYPRTPHLPWSEGATNDDIKLPDASQFEGKEVVVTVKMDGENTTLYRDGFHARSVDSGSHPSRDYVKQLWGQIKHDIPEGWRICGENLFAKHSIGYQNLPSYFMVFSIWNEKNEALSWKETQEWSQLLGLQTVPVLYEGKWDPEAIKALAKPTFGGDAMEGYVVRRADAFSYDNFGKSIAKFVRKGHVQPDSGHWMQKPVERNNLRRDGEGPNHPFRGNQYVQGEHGLLRAEPGADPVLDPVLGGQIQPTTVGELPNFYPPWNTDKTDEERESRARAASKRVTALAEKLGFPRDLIKVSRQPRFIHHPIFGDVWPQGMTNPRTWEVTIYAPNLKDTPVEFVAAHEIGHVEYLRAEGITEAEQYGLHEAGLLTKRPDGTEDAKAPSDEQRKRFRAYAGAWDLGLISGDGYKQLAEEDGVTDYSEGVWGAYENEKVPQRLALHETYAEISARLATGEKLEDVAKPMWQKYFTYIRGLNQSKAVSA